MKKGLFISILSAILVFEVVFPFYIQAEPAANCQEYCDSCKSGSCTEEPPLDENCICSPITATSVPALVKTITNWVFYIAIVLSPLMILIGAFFLMTAAGDPKRVETGKKFILWTIVGIAVILFSRVIIGIVRGVLGG